MRQQEEKQQHQRSDIKLNVDKHIKTPETSGLAW